MDNPRRTTRGRGKKDITKSTKGSAKGTPESPVSGTKGVNVAQESSPRKKSPARRASPGRTRTSPSRKRTSPVRRSSRPRSTIPTVQTGSAKKEETEVKVSYTHLPTTLTTNTSTRAPGKKTTTSSTQSSYSSTTQKTVDIRPTTASDINKLTDFIRRSATKTIASLRSRKNREEESFTPSQHTDGESHYTRSVSRSLYDGDDRYSQAEFSDSEGNDAAKSHVFDENEHYESFDAASGLPRTYCRKLSVPTEFGGWIGISLLLVLIPFSVYYLQWCCTSKSCTFKIPNFYGIWDKNYVLQSVFNGKAVAAYLGFNFSVFVLSAFLFGRGVRLPGSTEYRFKALPMSIFYGLAIYAAEHFDIPVTDFVTKNFLRFCIYGFVNAYIVALFAYIRAGKVKQTDAVLNNVYAKSGNFLVDFALGRQLNPKWLGWVELKQVFYRTSIISTFIYAICLMYKTIHFASWPEDKTFIESILHIISHGKYDKITVLCANMVALHALDSIVFEHHLASSFELQGEGFGCLLLLRYAATPCLLSAVAKYFYVHQIPINGHIVLMIAAHLIFCLGLFFKRYCNSIKYKYRVQPNSEYFQDVATIPTFQGKRLLLGSIWGNLRQPNYLGDIVAIIGLGLPLAIRFAWPPLISLALIVLLLVHRCLRVNERNTLRYQAAWVRYRSRARYYLLPKIF